MCAENGLPADLALKKGEWKRYIEPTLKWIYSQSGHPENAPPGPVTSETTLRGPHRKVLGAVKVPTGGWRLHLACGHRISREAVKPMVFTPENVSCAECAHRRIKAEPKPVS
jgi:hypothetical protein